MAERQHHPGVPRLASARHQRRGWRQTQDGHPEVRGNLADVLGVAPHPRRPGRRAPLPTNLGRDAEELPGHRDLHPAHKPREPLDGGRHLPVAPDGRLRGLVPLVGGEPPPHRVELPPRLPRRPVQGRRVENNHLQRLPADQLLRLRHARRHQQYIPGPGPRPEQLHRGRHAPDAALDGCHALERRVHRGFRSIEVVID